MSAIMDCGWDGYCSWKQRVDTLGSPRASLNPVTYAPIGNAFKPFLYQDKRYTRDELMEMGLDVYAKEAIARY